MSSKWNLMKLAAVAFLMIAGAGCGGISASRSISPASFLLPGLVEAEPGSKSNPQAAPDSNALLAQSN